MSNPPSLEQTVTTYVKNYRKNNKKWIQLTFTLAFFFTLFKFPISKMNSFIKNTLESKFAEQDIFLSSKQVSLKFKWGVVIEIEKPTLRYEQVKSSFYFDKIILHPQLFSLLTGKIGLQVECLNDTSKLFIEIKKGLQYSTTQIQLKNISLKTTPLTQITLGLNANGIIEGDIQLKTNNKTNKKTEGFFNISVKDLVVLPQVLFHFPLPRIYISQLELKTNIQNQSLQVLKAHIGNAENDQDDILGNIEGNVLLEDPFNKSKLDLKIGFNFSQKLLDGISLLESILKNAKQPNGLYQYSIKGSLDEPDFQPYAIGN